MEEVKKGLPIAHAHRILMDQLSPITPLAPISSCKNQWVECNAILNIKQYIKSDSEYMLMDQKAMSILYASQRSHLNFQRIS